MTSSLPAIKQVLQVVVDVLGFHPDHSLVVVVYAGTHQRLRVVWRIDLLGGGEATELPQDLDEAAAAWMLEAARACDLTVAQGDTVFVLEYPMLAGPVDTPVEEFVVRGHVNRQLCERLVAHLGSFSVCLVEHTVTPAERAAVATHNGVLIASHREELEAEVRRNPMARSTPPVGLPSIDDDLIDIAVEHIVDCLTGDEAPNGTDQHLAAMGLCHVRVRDTVLWDLIALNPIALSVAAPRLVSILQTTWPDAVPPVATLLGVVRWQLGDDIRATIAIDVALQHKCDYRLAELVFAAVRTGVCRREWRESLLGMGREVCRQAQNDR